jgi:periplasmic protein CpxP/Spy
MEQNRFLKVIVVLLIVINAGTLAFMWSKKPHRPPHPELGEYLMRELNFTPGQRKQFEVLKRDHIKLAAPWRIKNRELHQSFYLLVDENPSDTVIINALLDSISYQQRKIENSMFYHIKDVRALCTPEQAEKFDDVIKGAIQLMGPPPHPLKK